MNNLPAIKNANALIIPNEQIEKLRDQFPVMASAYSSDIIGLMRTNDLIDQITNIIASCFQQLGQKVSGEDLAVLGCQLHQELTKFPLMHIGEISLACTKGVRNEYPEVNPSVTISLVRILGWLKSYRSSMERREFLAEKAKLEEKPVPSLEEQFYLARSNAIKALEDRAFGRFVDAPGVVVYDFLKDLGMINFSKEERWGFWEEAKEAVKNEMVEKKIKADNNTVKVKIQQYIDTISDSKNDALVVSKSKKIALNRYLDEVIFNEIDLKSEIDQRKELFLTLNKQEDENQS